MRLSLSKFVDEKFQIHTEELAQSAFSRMDTQLDLSIKVLTLQLPFKLDPTEIPVWSQLEKFSPKIVDDKLLFCTDAELFCERKLSIPDSKIFDTIRLTHQK